jgi:peptide/nickel transport system substrate-binding protein
MKYAKIVLLVSSLLSGLALSGYALAADPKGEPKLSNMPKLGLTAGKAGGSYTLGIPAAPGSFNYYGITDNNAYTVLGNVFEGLVEYNLETYKMEPNLAKSWTVTEGGKVWTFQLRPGVKWHDGTPFTSADVVFTFQNIILNPEAKGNSAGAFPKGVKFEAVDGDTVRMTLPTTAGAILQQLRVFMMPKHKLLKYSIEGGATPAEINNAWGTASDLKEIVGTGPFKFSSYVADQKISLAKNENYWKKDAFGNKLPYLDKLEYLIVKSDDQKVAQFKSGTLDAINITGAQFPELKQAEVSGGNFKVVRALALFGSPPHLAFNFDAKDPDLARLFSNDKFRAAVQPAVNRKRIIEDVFNGLATLPGTPVAPVSSFYFDTTKYLGDYNLEGANAGLDALGLKDTDGDGIRNFAGGRNIEFSMMAPTDNPFYPGVPIATVIQNDLKAIGLKANLQPLQNSLVFSKAIAGDFEATIYGFGNQPDPDLRKPIWQPGGDLYYWHPKTRPSEPGGPANFKVMKGWEKRIYAIFDAAQKSTDPGQRGALYDEWQTLNAKYLPVIMIAKAANIAAVSNKIGNFVYNLGPIPGYVTNQIIFNK